MPTVNEDMSRVEEEIERITASGDTVLHLNYANLSEFPRKILEDKRCEDVRRIYAKRNVLRSLPDNYGVLKNLVELYLPFNGLQTIPPGISHLVKLESLDLSNNDLTVIPTALCRLSSLEKLILTLNALKSLPPEIGNLQKLQVLEVMNNKLRAIPVEMAMCASLERCLFDRNIIRSLPAELCQMRNLKELSLTGNMLLCLPPDLGEMNSLRSVYVNNNPHLHALPASVTNQEIGFSHEEVGVAPGMADGYMYIDITGCDGNTRRIYLPKGLKVIDADAKTPVSLTECCLKEVHLNLDLDDGVISSYLPKELCATLRCPLAHCQTCSRPIFSQAYPMIFEGQISLYELYRLALCCSWRCVQLSAHIIQLPLLYPDPTQLQLAVALPN